MHIPGCTSQAARPTKSRKTQAIYKFDDKVGFWNLFSLSIQNITSFHIITHLKSGMFMVGTYPWNKQTFLHCTTQATQTYRIWYTKCILFNHNFESEGQPQDILQYRNLCKNIQFMNTTSGQSLIGLNLPLALILSQMLHLRHFIPCILETGWDVFYGQSSRELIWNEMKTKNWF